MVCQTPLAVTSLHEEKGGMWIVGGWLYCHGHMHEMVVLILLFYMLVDHG